jgi:uncharacterized RDD family membrane protein YckC
VIEQSQPSVLPRRIAASAVDLFLVGFLWLLTLYRLAVRFEIAQREPDGTPIYSANQREALLEISEGINFGRIIGDFYYSIHGSGLVFSFLSLVIYSLIAWVLVPANTGWSVGHRAFGLAVTDMNGNKPPLDSYLRRYLVGAVDLFPYIVPGLLGWLVASRNETHQRIGDLSADTLVVDATAVTIDDMPTTTTKVIRPGTPEPAQPPAPEDPASMIDIQEAIAGHTGDADYPVLDLEDTSDIVPTVEVRNAEIALSELISDGDGGGGESGFVASMTEHEETVLAGEAEATEDALPEESLAENWHFPESQEAPVWTPEPTTNNGPKAAEPAAAGTTSKPDKHAAAAASAEGMGDPVWNKEWKAWLYWDAVGKQWLRHDADSGWTPIGDSQKA